MQFTYVETLQRWLRQTPFQVAFAVAGIVLSSVVAEFRG